MEITLTSRQAIKILEDFYGSSLRFCPVRLEAAAVARLGYVAAQNIIRAITQRRLAGLAR